MNKKLIIFSHYIILALAISLPFWLEWKIVAIIMIGYYLVFTRGIGYCPLTVWQYGTAEEGFIEKHFVSLFKLLGFPNLKRRNLQLFIRYGLPLLLVLTSFFRKQFSS